MLQLLFELMQQYNGSHEEELEALSWSTPRNSARILEALGY